MPRLQTITSLHQVANAAFDPKAFNVMDDKYMAIADGNSHPLSDRYTTLAEAQAVYPKCGSALIDSLDIEIDTCAIMEAYLDAASSRVDDPLDNYINNSNAVSWMGLRPSLVIPKRYYRITPGKVWFLSAVDVYGQGAIFIGHSMGSAGKNYFRNPSDGQESWAKAIVSIGTLLPTLYPEDYYSLYVNNDRYGTIDLPVLYHDDGDTNIYSESFDERCQGTALWLGGMHNMQINVNGIFGLFRYGIVWGPVNRGASFNDINMREIRGPLINFKFCPIELDDGSDQLGYLTSNRLNRGFNSGPHAGTGGNATNSGICFDFDNQDHKRFNYPMPSGYWQRIVVDNFTISDFIIESNQQHTAMRLFHVRNLHMLRTRGEGWDRGIPTGIGISTEGTHRIPRDFAIEADYCRNDYEDDFHGVKVSSGLGIHDIILEDFFGCIPRIEYHEDDNREYRKNTIAIRGKNFNGSSSRDNLYWKTEEDYYTVPGTGPVITSTDGLAAFRLQVEKTEDGAYGFKAEEVGHPMFAARISGTSEWTTFKDNLHYDTIQASIGDWIEIVPLRNWDNVESDHDFSIGFVRNYIDQDTGLREGQNLYPDDAFPAHEDAPYFKQLTASGVYALQVGTYYFNTPTEDFDPMNSGTKGYTSPPLHNRRLWPDAIYVS